MGNGNEQNMRNQKRSKYGVDLTSRGKSERTYQGVTYDSKTEMKFYTEVIEPGLKSGEIIKCERQVVYILQEGFTRDDGKKIQPIKYISDFDVYYKDGRKVIFDVKGGVVDPVCLLKRKLFWYRYPNETLVFICRNLKYGGWLSYEDLTQKKRESIKNI